MGAGWERRRASDDEWVSGHDWTQAWKHLPHGVILSLVLIAMLAGGGYAIRKVLLPAEESLRREVYEDSKSYRDGTIRDLDNVRTQWLGASDDLQRKALADVALRRSVDFPEDALPEHLREWLSDLRVAPQGSDRR